MRNLNLVRWSAGFLAVTLAGGCGNLNNDVNNVVELFVQADNARQTFVQAVQNGVRGERPVDTLLPAWSDKLTTAVSQLGDIADAWENANQETKTKGDSKINVELKGYLDLLFSMNSMATLKVPSWTVGTTNFSFQEFATNHINKINTNLDRVLIYYKRLYPGQPAPQGHFALNIVVDACLEDTRDACVAFYTEISTRANDIDNPTPGAGLCREYGLLHCQHQMDIPRLRADYGSKSVCGKLIPGDPRTARCIRSHTNNNTTQFPDGGSSTMSETICDEYEPTVVPADWLGGSAESHLSDNVVLKAGCQ